MKRLTVSLILSLLFVTPVFPQAASPAASSTSAPTAPQHPATPDQIREYFQLIHLDRSVHELMDQMMNVMQTTAAPYYPASMWNDLRETIGDYDLLEPLVSIYQKYISTEDMASILVFYRSDAGQHVLAAQPHMTAESQTIFREIGRKLGEDVAKRHFDEIVAAKKKYDEDIAARQNSSKKPN